MLHLQLSSHSRLRRKTSAALYHAAQQVRYSTRFSAAEQRNCFLAAFLQQQQQSLQLVWRMRSGLPRIDD